MKKELKCYIAGCYGDMPALRLDEYDDKYSALIERIKLHIEELIIRGYTYFIADLCYGLGVVSAQLVLKLKKKYPTIKLECIPLYNSITKARVRTINIIKSSDLILDIMKEADVITNLKKYVWHKYPTKHVSVMLGIRSGHKISCFTQFYLHLAKTKKIPTDVVYCSDYLNMEKEEERERENWEHAKEFVNKYYK